MKASDLFVKCLETEGVTKILEYQARKMQT